jgi:hypothetical protein
MVVLLDLPQWNGGCQIGTMQGGSSHRRLLVVRPSGGPIRTEVAPLV